ncbi:cell division protein FtsQ/DivIB [Cellulomonas hominis]
MPTTRRAPATSPTRGPATGPRPAAPGPAPGEPSVTTYTAGRRALGFPVRPSVVSTSSAARFAERARVRRRLAWRQIVLVSGGTLAVLALAWLLFWSPVLALDVDEVQVSGAGTVVAVDQVMAVVAESAGTPLPRLDTVGLRDAILEVPGVRAVRVARDWPTGLVIELVSREPVAAVPEQKDPATGGAAAGTGYALVDQDGVQVGRVDAAPEGLPVVDVPVGDARTLTAVLTVLQSLPADLLAQVGQISAQTQDTVTMLLRDGAQVDWGSAGENPLKAAVLQALRAAPTSAGAAVYDVSAPTLPIVK